MNLVNFGEGLGAKVWTTNEAHLLIPASEKETKMIKNRLFNVFVMAALTLMVVLAVQGAIETRKVAARAAEHSPGEVLCDLPLAERTSIQRVYVEGMDTWLTYTDGGPTGVDGGLIHLLSNARNCSN